MTEEDGRDIVRSLVGPAAFARLEALVRLVIEESANQNLIARSTVGAIWVRHVLDSIQLVSMADQAEGLWIDIGTGGGFPGLAIAAVTQAPTLLVEPRRLRASFLLSAVQSLGLARAEVKAAKIETVGVAAAVISARAVAPIENLLQAAAQCATSSTRWLFPRGRVTPPEIATLARRTGMVFHVKQSLSSADSLIVVANGRL